MPEELLDWSLVNRQALRAHDSHADTMLEKAVNLIEAAVSSGQAPDSMVAEARARLFGPVIKPEELHLAPGLQSSVALRTLPFAAQMNPLSPAWAKGQRPDATLGPFQNQLGEAVWVDQFIAAKLWTVSSAPNGTDPGTILARLPLFAKPRTGVSLLGGGSVWLPASMLVPGRPSDEFVGLQIKSGQLKLTGSVAASGFAAVLSGEWTLRLSLNLDSPKVAVTSGVGADATKAKPVLPAKVVVAIGPQGLKSLTIDDFSVEIYATTVSFHQASGAATYDATSKSIVVPATASTNEFAIAAHKSTVLESSASAPILAAGWALPVATSAPEALAEAAGTGQIWMLLGTGITLHWDGVEPTVTSGLLLQVAPGAIAITAIGGHVEQSFDMWEQTPRDDGEVRLSQLSFSSRMPAQITYVCEAGLEGLILPGAFEAHTDRPVTVDGMRLRVQMPEGILIIMQSPAGMQLMAIAADAEATKQPHIALAIENALFKVRPPSQLVVTGQLQGAQLAKGSLALRFALRSLLPTLPDPYVSTFDSAAVTRADVGFVVGTTAWETPDESKLGFALELPPNFAAATRAATPLRTKDREQAFFLLDVSSNVDQFGVAVLEGSNPSINGMALTAPSKDIELVTLPPISWEPMLSKAPKKGVDPQLEPPPHDGGAASMRVETVHLVPVMPTALYHHYESQLVKPSGFFRDWQQPRVLATLPLCFGITAEMASTAEDPTDFNFDAPSFANALQGARQISIRAHDEAGSDRSRVLPSSNAGAKKIDPSLPGRASLTAQYAESVLSTNLATRWQGDPADPQIKGDFDQLIPVKRYDWCGYGASMLSDWRNRAAVGPAIIQARFDVLVGRTAYEVVQMQSHIYPWAIRVVRTITIERQPGGWVFREDSGWVAASDGAFDFPRHEKDDYYALDPKIPPAFDSAHKHIGAITGVFNPQNIEMVGTQFKVPVDGEPSCTYQAVTFDAQVGINSTLRVPQGGSSGSGETIVRSRGATGYILISGPQYKLLRDEKEKMRLVQPTNAERMVALLNAKGPAVAPISCTIEAGATKNEPGLSVRADSIEVSCAGDSPDRHLVVALRGSPQFSRDGAWSVGRKEDGATAPAQLPNGAPVPLVRPSQTPAGTVTQRGADHWHVADPADILEVGTAGSPRTTYGFLQSTGTQKVFFAHPKVANNSSTIEVPNPPWLADVASLFNATGIFPNLGDALQFETLKSISLVKQGFAFADTFALTNQSPAVIMDFEAAQVVLVYENETKEPTQVTVEVNPSASNSRWSFRFERVCFQIRIAGKAFVSIYATAIATENSAPTVTDLNVRYGPDLEILQGIFSNIQHLSRFLPGAAAAVLKVGFSQGKLSVRNSFALPTLPLGAGTIEDVSLELGCGFALAPKGCDFSASIGSVDKPFRWIVSPLAGDGLVRVGIVNGDLDVLVRGSLGLGLAINLEIASGSASVTLGISFEINPFKLMGILSGHASVDVLDGLVSASLSLSAGLGFSLPNGIPAPEFPPALPLHLGPYTLGLHASVSVGIHISICWVIDIDFDGSWEFSKTITTPAISLP